MALVERTLDEMVEGTLTRIVNANIGITNTSPGSVVRTIIEAIMTEMDITNYNIMQSYGSKIIDDATGDEIDAIGTIFGLTRNPATSAVGIVTFTTTEASVSDIYIQYNQIVSTQQNANGDVYEAMVTDLNAKLPAGELSTTANISMLEPGSVYIPANTLIIMNTSIIGITNVTNTSIISGGTDEETDDEFRTRIKNALFALGKGTIKSLENSVKGIDGVADAVVLDMNDGVGTADVVVVTKILPPSSAIQSIISLVVAETKSAGIKINIVYPTIIYIDVTVTTTGGDNSVVGKAIYDYTNSLGIADTFIIRQMENAVLTALGDATVDIVTVAPTANVNITGTQAIKSGTITVNREVYTNA